MKKPALTCRSCCSLAFAALASALAGCSPASSVQSLPFDSKLEALFAGEFGQRASDVDILSIALVCDAQKKLKGEVTLSTRTANSREITLRSGDQTSCSEKGVLVHVKVSGMRYDVRSKYAYDSALVRGQWRNAIDHAVGSLAYSDSVTSSVRATHGKELAEAEASQLDFICDDKTNFVRYQGYARGNLREGVSGVACPTGSEKGHAILRLSTPLTGYVREADRYTYRVLVTKAVDAEFAGRVLDDFLRIASPRETF
jgi:hypothetical protein